jgi:hypothetical protein
MEAFDCGPGHLVGRNFVRFHDVFDPNVHEINNFFLLRNNMTMKKKGIGKLAKGKKSRR